MARPIPLMEQPKIGMGENAERNTPAATRNAAGRKDTDSNTRFSEAHTPEQWQQENSQLRQTVAELEERLREATQAAQLCKDQHGDFDRLLDEKSDTIRELYLKIKELQAKPAANSNGPKEDDLVALSEELERERRQLREDEESLMQQMRDMEVQMSRERAEMARQRGELLRQQEETRRELELAGRDSDLRERLLTLQRRQQEVLRQPANSAAEPSASRPKDSRLIRRLFGG